MVLLNKIIIILKRKVSCKRKQTKKKKFRLIETVQHIFFCLVFLFFSV